ncbi:SDR family oxidoreductase [Conexibacter sp. DBS9H8]|uniref:SDR family oxidoreductase n=1 Tax=Conexibacter sp. DBS9H8 TaxID=2937801 RepID=UPI00200BCE07|nr:NAD-dependent epimerase/dehydratase family protein [Conexibacter sp. DBS9H8]
MRIALTGASGRLGAPLARLLEEGGHEVRRLHRASPSHPVDLRTGAGLTTALADVEVVVHAANAVGSRPAAGVLLEGSRRLVAGAPDAHHLLISIAGVDRVAAHSRYYALKLAQERLLTDGRRPASILRSTQFHEFVGVAALRAARLGLELRASIPLAPVAAAEVAAVLARLATGAPTTASVTLCGPETLTVSQLRVHRGLPLPVPRAGALLRALGDGALVPPDPDIRGVLTYPQWLTERFGRPWRPAPTAARGS